MADGASLPFDALWLLQNAANFSVRQDKAPLFHTPLCTMFAALGDRAGADGLLVGRTLDWTAAEVPVITEVRPETGHRFVQIGFPWNVGVFTGMNDAGLLVCVQRLRTMEESDLEGAPIEMVAVVFPFLMFERGDYKSTVGH